MEGTEMVKGSAVFAPINFDISEAAVKHLEAKYSEIKIVDDASYKFVMSGLREYRELRKQIDEKHREIKAPGLEFCRKVDAERNRLKKLLEPGETHLRKIKTAEDLRKLEEKKKREQAAMERKRKLIAQIDEIRNALSRAVPLDSIGCTDLVSHLGMIKITKAEFGEFYETAINAIRETSESIRTLAKQKKIAEIEAAQVKREEELAPQPPQPPPASSQAAKPMWDTDWEETAPQATAPGIEPEKPFSRKVIKSSFFNARYYAYRISEITPPTVALPDVQELLYDLSDRIADELKLFEERLKKEEEKYAN